MALPFAPFQVTRFAVYSRLFLALLQIVFNNLIPDHAAGAFHQEPLTNPTTADHIVEFLLGGFRKWDGAYFLHITENGYTKSHMFAFFPLFPLTVRFMADTILYPLLHIMQLRSMLMISGWLLNTISFTLAAVALYDLTWRLFKNKLLAFIAAILFCINPASVFMSAMYTEALFCALTLYGMLLFEQGYYILSAVMFGLSSATRANGMVSVGFVIYHSAHQIIYLAPSVHHVRNFHNLKILCRHFVTCTTRILYSCVIIILPFLLFQLYAFLRACRQEENISIFRIYEFSQEILSRQFKGGKAPELDSDRFLPQWCNSSVVVPYSAIQAGHWDVGLMKYYELKQIPNFILAFPIIFLCLHGALQYLMINWQQVKYLGLLQPIRRKLKSEDEGADQSHSFFHQDIFVYWVHGLVLLLFGVLCMHVQVVTRFLASNSPILYWISAHILQSSLQNYVKPSPEDNGSFHPAIKPTYIVWTSKLSWKGRLVRGYFWGYFVTGVAMHCNFLPWT